MSVLLLSLLVLRLWKRNQKYVSSKVEKPVSSIRGVKMDPKSLLRASLSLSGFIRTNATSYNCLVLLPDPEQISQRGASLAVFSLLYSIHHKSLAVTCHRGGTSRGKRLWCPPISARST